jgi:hypothetical protein
MEARNSDCSAYLPRRMPDATVSLWADKAGRPGCTPHASDFDRTGAGRKRCTGTAYSLVADPLRQDRCCRATPAFFCRARDGSLAANAAEPPHWSRDRCCFREVA